ncbi:MAG TPA: hypothetical protein DCY86_05045 [Bdellovibrionales bacterium]|nr:hypothetical protein [Bdellovibrionales bacterium]
MFSSCKKLTHALCVAAIFIVSFAPVAEAKVTADQCSNGLTQAQIDQLYKINVQETRIAEMCHDSALDPKKLDQLIGSHKVPSLEEMNKCIADVSALFTEFDDLINKGFDVAQDALTFTTQCQAIVSPAQVASCVAQAQNLQTKSQNLRDQGVVFSNKTPPVQQQCKDALTKDSAQMPDSFVRRILDNNKASDVLNTDWKKAFADWQATGKLPDDITPYYPEERDALKMLGLTDEDLQYMPPRNFAAAAEDFAVEQMNKGLDAAIPTAAGLGLHVLLVLGWAIGSWFHLIGCASRASVWVYIAGSMTYIALEIALAFEYKELIDRIQKLIGAAKKSVQVTLDDVKALQDEAKGIAKDGKEFSTEVKGLYNTCKDLVGQMQSTATSVGSSLGSCLPSIPGVPGVGGGTGTGTSQQCLDDTREGYNDSSAAIQDCMARAQAAGLSAEELKQKGMTFLDNVDKAGQGAVNQLKLLKYARDTMQKVTDIINDKSRNTFIFAAVLTASAAIAMAEVFSNWWVLGACTGDAGPPPHLQMPNRKYAQGDAHPSFTHTLAQALLSVARAEDGDDGATGSGSGSGQPADTRKFKKFSQKEVEEKIDQMVGHDVISLVVGLGIGLLVGIIMQILIAVLSGKASGIARSIFLAAGAAIGFTSGVLLNNAGNLMQSYTDKVTTVIDAMERTMGNEGWKDDGSEWQGPAEKPQTYWEQGQEIIKKFTKLGEEIMGVSVSYAANTRKNCLAGGENSMRIDPICNCAAQGNCKQLSFPQQLPIPKEISSKAFTNQAATVKDLRSYSSSILNGDKDHAMTYAPRMTARQKGLEAELGMLQKAVNQNLTKKHGTPLDFSRETEKLKSDITTRVQRTFNNFPAEVRNNYNKRMDGMSTPPPVADKAMDSQNQRMRPVINRLKDFFKTLGPLGQRKFTRKKEDVRTKKALAKNIDWSDAGVIEDGAAKPDLGAITEDMEVEGSDINQDTNLSIFKIITNRYLKKFMAE